MKARLTPIEISVKKVMDSALLIAENLDAYEYHEFFQKLKNAAHEELNG